MKENLLLVAFLSLLAVGLAADGGNPKTYGIGKTLKQNNCDDTNDTSPDNHRSNRRSLRSD